MIRNRTAHDYRFLETVLATKSNIAIFLGQAFSDQLSRLRALSLSLALCGALSACVTVPGSEEPTEPEAPPQEEIEETVEAVEPLVPEEDPFFLEQENLAALRAKQFARPGTQLAMLVPLTGRAAPVGKAIVNAAQIALFDMRNEGVSLIPIDTKGTPLGAEAAIQEAIEAGADLILGPLLSDNVRRVAPIARDVNLKVVSFSNNPAVAGDGVYVLGFSPAAQVAAIVGFAALDGRRNFAALAPRGPYGELVVQSYQAAVANIGGALTHVRFVDADNPDFSETIIPMSDYKERRRALLREQAKLEGKTDSASVSALRRLEELDTLGDPQFDTILLPMTSSTSLKTAAAQLAYYDVDQPAVRVLGLQIWEDFPRLNTEPSLVGSWFTAPDGANLATFQARYRKAFGAAPPRLATLGYDAIALSVLLAGEAEEPDFSDERLTDEQGFFGIDGLFRLLPTGVAERAYAVREITSDEIITVQPARDSFAPAIN